MRDVELILQILNLVLFTFSAVTSFLGVTELLAVAGGVGLLFHLLLSLLHESLLLLLLLLPSTLDLCLSLHLLLLFFRNGSDGKTVKECFKVVINLK